jgi:hypothetical protein
VLAGCVLHVRCADILCAPMRSSTAGNSELLCASHTLSAFREQCSKYLWTICIPPDTIFVTFM